MRIRPVCRFKLLPGLCFTLPNLNRACGRGCDWREIPGAHSQCTVQRMAALPVVLCLTDTTALDFNGQTITGLGPLSFEAQRGMYLHPTCAVSTELETGASRVWCVSNCAPSACGQVMANRPKALSK